MATWQRRRTASRAAGTFRKTRSACTTRSRPRCLSYRGSCGSSSATSTCTCCPCLEKVALASSTTVRLVWCCAPRSAVVYPVCYCLPRSAAVYTGPAYLPLAELYRCHGTTEPQHLDRLGQLVEQPGARAGQWRGLDVAIKTVTLEGAPSSSQKGRASREAAIASNLVHPNIMATYSHDVQAVPSAPRFFLCCIFLELGARQQHGDVQAPRALLPVLQCAYRSNRSSLECVQAMRGVRAVR